MSLCQWHLQLIRCHRLRRCSILLPWRGLDFQVWSLQQTGSSDYCLGRFIALSLLVISTNILQTNRHVYLVAQSIVNNQLVISSERTIPIGAIKAVSTSNLKDDWFSLVIGAQEPDPLLTCVFKTEFFTHLSNTLRGSLNLKIGER